LSFVFAAALAIAALASLPVLAHLLRRSRAEEQEFPAAHLVPTAQPVARKRRKLEDRALLAARALLILALAFLGATPLVRCSRLTLERDGGASVALSLVLDDSHSMRTRLPNGKPRWDAALAGARELLDTARSGDAVAIILAGKPARLVMPATTDLEQVKRTLSELVVSDRATDLDAAVKLAEASVLPLPHKDRRVVLLSDLAGRLPEASKVPLTAPLTELTKSAADCGVVSAARFGRRATLRIACNSSSAAKGRVASVVLTEAAAPTPDGAATGKSGEELGQVALEHRGGVQELSVELPVPVGRMNASLSGRDALAENDTAPIAPESGKLGVGVVRDTATTSVVTGGATIIEQALTSLQRDVSVFPHQVLPDQTATLSQHALLVIDDPAGIVAEARTALTEWLKRGRVAIALVGPRAEAAPLGSTFEPFARGALRWQKTSARGADPTSLSILGDASSSLADLEPNGRALLAAALPPEGNVLGKWNDGEPFAIAAPVGRGLALTVSLPASLAESDFSLRPGFLALLSHALDEAERRTGPRRSIAGETWTFPAAAKVEVRGPGSTLLQTTRSAGADDQTVVVAEAGRYSVDIDGDVTERFVNYAEDELTILPSAQDMQDSVGPSVAVQSNVDASRELALLCLLLFGAEVGLRAVRYWRKAALSA
jgi:Mg-chelatase subunit ChlD